MEIEGRYSQDQAFEEAEKLQQKILSGEASNYSDAEKLLEKQSPEESTKDSPFQKKLYELKNREPTEDERQLTQERVVDILSDPNIVVHTTNINYLFDVLRFGLGSVAFQRKLHARGLTQEYQRYSYGTDTQDILSQDDKRSPGRDLISFTLNKEGIASRQLFNDKDDVISLIYFYPEVEEKFKGLADNQKSEKLRRIWKGLEKDGLLTGLWKGEFLAKRRIPTEYIRGIAVGESVANLKLSEFAALSETNARQESEKRFDSNRLSSIESVKNDFNSRGQDLDTQKKAIVEYEGVGLSNIEIQKTGQDNQFVFSFDFDGQKYFIPFSRDIMYTDDGISLPDFVRHKIIEKLQATGDFQSSPFHLVSNNNITKLVNGIFYVMHKASQFGTPEDAFKVRKQTYQAERDQEIEKINDRKYIYDPKQEHNHLYLERIKLINETMEVLGDVTIGDVMGLIQKEIQVPIYRTNKEERAYTVSV